MKNAAAAFFMVIGMSAFAQDKTVTNTQTETPVNPRTAQSSSQTRTSPLPYNVNDKYMGRKEEFLNMLTVTELPADFPVYDKEWGVKEYNAVIDAYYTTHLDILKDRVKEKIQQKMAEQQPATSK